jgi:aryl-alcohol dehydrogenase-like predicted oxidoreductase
MLTRRNCLALTAKTWAALALPPRMLNAQAGDDIITRAIPATGEQLPIIGLGSSATFSRTARNDDVEIIKSVFEALIDNGGTVFDTAPGYGRGASEEIAGRAVNELGIQNRVFWATKLNVAGFGGGSADRTRALAQAEASFQRIGREPIDVMQVHNLGDMATQLPILRELKERGRVRYVGATSTFGGQRDELERIMRTEPLDFVGFDYAVDNHEAAENRFLPIAEERGIAVLVYMPFGRTRLWNRVAGHAVPGWAQEFGAATWAQFFLKFAAAHPAVTCVTPATSQPHHMVDNMGAARGRLPDAAERRRMIELIESLPGG